MTIFTMPPLTQPRLRAAHAILVYEEPGAGGTDCALMTHRIEHTEHGVRLGSGRLFGPEEQKALLDILLGATSQDSTYLPPEVIAHGSARLAWYVPGRVRPMWFRFQGKSRRLTVPWPTLLFTVSRGSLRLAALARTERPQADTQLFHAPLMNVHANTSLCTGSAILPSGVSLAERSGFEAAVYETNFTHCNHERTLTLPGSGTVSNAAHFRFYRSLASDNPPHFPATALVPMKLSVSQWLAQCFR
jgi:PRTRC genetic system protein B